MRERAGSQAGFASSNVVRVGLLSGMMMGLTLIFGGSALAAQPPNTNRSSAIPITSGNQFGYNDDRDGTAAGTESGEDTVCDQDGSVVYGATVWYRFTAPANGTATVDAIAGSGQLATVMGTSILSSPHTKGHQARRSLVTTKTRPDQGWMLGSRSRFQPGRRTQFRLVARITFAVVSTRESSI